MGKYDKAILDYMGFTLSLKDVEFDLRDWQVAMAAFVAPQEPGPREWSPRTDPRYCRKAASGV